MANSFDLALFFFVVYTVAVAIIAVNLLISIMGDSYDRVQSKSGSEGLREKARIMMEMLDLLPADAQQEYEQQTQWVYVLRPRNASGGGGGGGGGSGSGGGDNSTDWEGRVSAMTKNIGQSLARQSMEHERHLQASLYPLHDALQHMHAQVRGLRRELRDNDLALERQQRMFERRIETSMRNAEIGNGGSVDDGGNSSSEPVASASLTRGRLPPRPSKDKPSAASRLQALDDKAWALLRKKPDSGTTPGISAFVNNSTAGASPSGSRPPL